LASNSALRATRPAGRQLSAHTLGSNREVRGVLRFAPIDLDAHGDISVRFKQEAFLVSFGSTDPFDQVYGSDPENYLNLIRHGLQRDPESCVHVWRGQSIVGQVELSTQSPFPSAGYVHLYFLVPEFRGQGHGAELDDYAASFFKKRRIRAARLSVSRSNAVALAFYERRGWVLLGPRDDHPASLLFEKHFGITDERLNGRGHS
jgi:ribosomal protein S18 acetylase RimI-like enzyme